jgi:hypothetical protein
VLAHGLVGNDPRDCGEGSRAGRAEEVAERLDVVDLPVVPNRVEPWAAGSRCRVSWSSAGPRCTPRRRWRSPAGFRRRRSTASYVVLVEEVGQVGPGVVGGLAPAAGRARWDVWVLDGRRAAHRVVLDPAVGRPAGDHVQVLRQAPGSVGLEHVILEDEGAGVRPVVRDLVPVVVAHHRGRTAEHAPADRPADALLAGQPATEQRHPHEAVHLAVVDGGHGGRMAVLAACLAVAPAPKGLHADVRLGIGRTDRRNTVLHRDPVRTRIGPEIGVERAVLLHDDHHVLDLVNPSWSGRAADGGGNRRGGHGPREQGADTEAVARHSVSQGTGARGGIRGHY